MKNLPMELMRTFTTIVDCGGFTSAGELLGRTQPAVSLQVKRLETLVGTPLLQREGRRVLPTAEGQTLLDYARRILSLNDEAVACLVKPQITGRVKLGIPNEFASSVLPRIVGAFAQTHPNVTLDVTCQLSKSLLANLQQHEFDLVIALHDEPSPGAGIKLWTEPLVWIGSRDRANLSRVPLPVIAAPAPCIYRSRMTHVLNELGAPWRIVYTSSSYGGICAAVSAGLGVTALAKSTVPEELRVLSAADRFPDLASIDVSVHYDQERASAAVLRLVDHIMMTLGAGPNVSDALASTDTT